MYCLNKTEQSKIMNELEIFDKSVEIRNKKIEMENKEIWQQNQTCSKEDRKKKKTKGKSLKTELRNREFIALCQQEFNPLLENSFYNREVSDYKNGNYLAAGQDIAYEINIKDKSKFKGIYGYNFNHTGSPFYVNRLSKINHLKIDKIIEYYQNANPGDLYYFVTFTMPNLIISEHRDIKNQAEEDNEMMKFANRKLNDLIKKVMKDFNIKGVIKKFECNYKEQDGQQQAHPHYHLLITVNKKIYNQKKILKGEDSLRGVVLSYWIDNFLKKKFKNYDEKEYMAGFDFKAANAKEVGIELAGYLAKGNNQKDGKVDYLSNQVLFDHYYCFMYRKRILTFVGEFKEINQLLNLDKEVDEMSDEELDDVENKLNKKEEFTHKIFFKYQKAAVNPGYKYTKIIELDKELECPKIQGFSPGLDNSTLTSKSNSLYT